MKKDLLHTPEGVRDIYNGECARKLVLQNRLRDVCSLYGYNDIQTPTIEFFDVFNKERGSVASNEMFKLFDNYGNTLVLRPDMTPSIARAAAKYFEDNEMPLKLCYSGNTFINVSKSYQGRLKENTTIGAELIGDASIDADFEIISMVIDCMKNAGLKEFQVEIGNVMFFKGLLSAAGISGDNEEELISLIQDKNYFGEEELLDSMNIDKHIKDVLLAMPQLFGSVDVLRQARQLTDNSDCIAAIDRLERLYELLKVTGYDEYITFDLGAISKHAYYTGIIFYAYTFGTGEPVISGGRYDKLIGQFGCDKASIGFSIVVDSLMAAINRQNLGIPMDSSGALIVYEADNLITAIKLSDSLRKMDIPVAMLRDIDGRTTAQCCEFAESSQLADVIFLNDISDLNADVKIIKAKTSTFRTATLEKIQGGNF